MTNKALYSAFCFTQPDMPVMFQPWWLEAVCAGKEWDVLLFTADDLAAKNIADGSTILAAMPYLIRKRAWMRYILMPQMTMFGGVWITQQVQAQPLLQVKLSKLITRRLKAMKLHYYCQQLPVGSPMPHWLGQQRMKVEERKTYQLTNLTDMQAVEAAFSKNKRRQLQKAQNLLVDYDMTAEEFFLFHKRCLAERHREPAYTREFLLVLEKKARRNNACFFLRITGPDSQVLAAAFLVRDRHTLYYLIPAFLPSASAQGASARLALEAIRLAGRENLIFDFEGGNDDNPGVANHYRQFGATPVTYYRVSKLYRPFFALALHVNALRTRRKFFSVKNLHTPQTTTD